MNWYSDPDSKSPISEIDLENIDYANLSDKQIKKLNNLKEQIRGYLSDMEAKPGDDTWWEEAYAFEALNKIPTVIDRARRVTEKIHLLWQVPKSVDRYMAEAAAAFRYESALQDIISKVYGDEYLVVYDIEKKTQSRVDLCGMIEFAAKRGKFLDLHLAETAHEIRKTANSIAHGRFEEVEDIDFAAENILFQTRLIMSKLFSQNYRRRVKAKKE